VSIVNIRLCGSKDVSWCGGKTLHQMSSTTNFDWSKSYDKYIEILLDNGDKITITEKEFLEKHYGK
jgi:hypothetical protein